MWVNKQHNAKLATEDEKYFPRNEFLEAPFVAAESPEDSDGYKKDPSRESGETLEQDTEVQEWYL